ncbi:response regulator [Acaryochloris sp. IP29b_bin.148]|uniref:response regulator n=1 Tax=Acaryochloris sp. IP29b_bin.148 TaxID=2969218 RepID=UPI0026182FC7|nr:response regulator [Acaryochloris sp. IP29b_bin.148]
MKNHQGRIASVPPTQLKVLVADDNDLNQELMVQRLLHLGYQADRVSNGLEVLSAIQANRYDLLLLDVQMPKMDGLQVTRQLRQQATSLYIIGISGRVLPEEEQECLDAGMDDYLCKPVALKTLATALNLYRPPTQPRPSIQPEQAPPLLDESALQALLEIGGDDAASFLISVIDNFLRDTEPMLQRLKVAITQQDTAQVNEIAHALKSMTVSMGAHQLTQRYQALEKMSKANALTLTSEWLQDLDQEVEQVRAALKHERQKYRSTQLP